MKRIFSTILQYTIFLGLGLFLLWWTTRNLSPEEIQHLKDALNGAKYLLVIPAMFFLLLAHYSRALRWKILMEPLGFQPSTINTFFAVMLGYFFNLLVPRLGEVMKCTLLARYEKTPVDKIIGTMVAERAIDVICLLIVIGVTVLLQVDIASSFLSEEWQKMMQKNPGSNGYSGLLLTIGLVAFFSILIFWIMFAHISVIGKIKGLFRGIWQGLTSVRFVKRRAAFIFHTVFIWSMYLLSIRIGFYAMESVSHLGINPSFTILSFGSLAMIITQGGIGAYQLVVQKTLTLYGISEVNGLAYGWLLWAVQTLMVLVVGLICLLLLPLFNKEKHESIRKNIGETDVA
jgi:glycosyltransferase 2 family protein